MTKINILIVEDNEDHLFFIKKFLPAEQYDLQEIVNGTEAYNYLLSPKVKPDVILLDNHLPGMNGLEILKKLGAKKEDYGFILTTIDSDPDILIKALKNGALDLLLKTPDYLYTLPLKIEKAYKTCQSRQASKQVEANFRSIIESGDDDIWSIDTNYKLTAFNQSFKKFILKIYNIKIKIGDDITKIFPKKENAFWEPIYAKALKGKKLTFEFSPLNDKLSLCYDIRLNPIFLNGIVVGLSVIGRDITNQKNIENDLFKAQQIAKLGSYKLDINSGVWQSSPILYSIFGIDDSFNKNIDGWLNIVHPEDRLMMQNHFMNDVVKNKGKFDKEYRIIRIDDRQERWVHGMGELILNDVGEPLQMFGTIQDITESKKIELAIIESKKQLQETNFFLQEAQNITLLGYYIYNFQTKQWKSSEMMSNLMGLKFNEGGLQQWIDIIIPEDKHILTDVLKKRLKQIDYPLDVTYRVKSKGNIHWIHHTAQPPQKDKIGQYLPVMGVLQDITESKKAEEKLKQSEKKFRELYEKSGDAILIIKNGIFIDCNKATIAMLKYKSKAAFLNMHPSKLSPKTQPNGQDSYSEAEKMMQIALKKGTHRFEWLHTKQDGTIFPVEVLLTTISNEPQNIIIHCVWRDITDRKQAEENLKQSEQLYKSVFESAPLGIFHFNNKSVITDVNKELVRIIGSTPKKIVGLNIYSDFTDNKMIEAVRSTLEKGSGYYEDNYTSVTANKTTPLVIRFKAIKDVENKIVGGVGLCEDITERKTIEKALKENEHQLQEAQQIAKLGHFVYDDATEIYTTSKILDTIVGIDSSYIKNKKGWIDLCHPEDLIAARCVFNSVTEKNTSQEFRMIRFNDKKIIWVFVTAKKEFDSSTGQRSKLIGTIQDITERKLSEEKLKQSDTILNKLNSLILVNEGESNIIYVSPSVKTVLGYEPEEIVGQGWWQLTFTDLKSVNNVKQTIREYLCNNSPLPIKVSIRKIKTKKGDYKWIEWYVSKGWENTVIAIGIDITEKYEKERRFKTIIDTANEVIILADHKGNIKEWNPMAMTIFGYSKEEILDKPLTKLMPPAYFGAHKKAFADLLKKGKVQNRKARIVEALTKNGQRFPIEISFNSWKEGNNLIYCAFIKDISERQRQEKVREVIFNITKKANESKDLSILFNLIRTELNKLIDTTNFFIALYDEDTDLISTPYMVDEKDDSDDFPKGKSLTGYIIDSKKSLIGGRSVFNKLAKEGKIAILGPSSKSWVGVPLLIDRVAIGAIVIQSYTEKNAYSQEDVALLELIASNISTAIKQKQYFEKIKQSDIILNKIDSLVLVGGLGGDLQYISPNIEKLLGYKPSELLGQKWWQMTFFDKSEIKKRQDILDQFILKGIAIKNQFITRKTKTKNGRFKWIEWHISKGVGNTYISIGIDVTERYRQENINNVIYNITKKANEALPKELFFDFIKRELNKLIDTANFYIALGNENSEFLTVPYMIDEKDTKDDFLKKNSLSGYVIDTKNTLLLNKTNKEHLKIKEQGTPSSCWLGTPLIIKNKVIGLIAVQSYTDEKAYTIEDVRLLELIANSISQVIKQSQDFEQINLLSHALIQSDEGVIITNIEGDIQYVNPAFTKLSGYTEKEVLGQNPRFLKSGKRTLEYYETLWSTILNGDIWSGEFINKRKDGSQYLVLANISPIKNSKGEITHFVGIEEDITEKRKLERNFLHAFIDAQEVEKQNFGEELHDGVSQILSAQTMFVDVLKTLLKNADAKVLKHLNTVKKLNTQAINETRSIAHGLMSKQLKESGLIVAIEQICNDYNTSRDINFSFGCKGLKEQEINAEIKSNIFRIIQEVSTNTVRHSVAKKAQIKLSKTTNNQLKVIVKDNGIGIDFERMKENKKGAGLENIKRRIQLLNGTIDLKTAPNKGTQYTFIIPLDNIQ